MTKPTRRTTPNTPTPPAAPPPRPAAPPLAAGLSADAGGVADALALLWAPRPATALLAVLRAMDLRGAGGFAFTQDRVRNGLQELARAGLVRESERQAGRWRLGDPHRAQAYRALLARHGAPFLTEALCEAESFHPVRVSYYWPVVDRGATVSLLHHLLFSGRPLTELRRLQQLVSQLHDWDALREECCEESFDPALFVLLPAEIQLEVTISAVAELCQFWDARHLPLADWVIGQLATAGTAAHPVLRLQAAELLLLRGERKRLHALLGDDTSPGAMALRAAAQAQEGRWAEARSGFEGALRAVRAQGGPRTRVFPHSLAWHYALALVAEGGTKALETARRFCAGEAGSRHGGQFLWGLWVHAIDVRLGRATRIPGAFDPVLVAGALPHFHHLWCYLLQAWLGPEAEAAPAAARRGSRVDVAVAVRQRLETAGLQALVQQLDAALACVGGKPPAGPFFVQPSQESWRRVLEALAELGSGGASGEGAATRLLWSLTLDADGRIDAVTPMEQKRGARGWNKPRPVPLSRLAAARDLSAADALVARTLRESRAAPRQWVIDRAEAVAALVGHPGVVLAENPEQTVELVEGTPHLEVERSGERFVVRLHPPVHDVDPLAFSPFAAPGGDALRYLTVERESPQRLRLYRLGEAQRRVATLLGRGLQVPQTGQADLEKVLQGLSAQFQVSSDHLEAAREVDPECTVRAEFSPQGEALLLRLVAAPLGADGPRMAPGSGRARVMASLGGETVGTRRDLERERAAVQAVVNAVPFLDLGEGAPAEWLLEDPEHGLEAVETLSRLPEVAALDWPRGRPVRVVRVDRGQLGLQLRGERDWFRLAGQARLDEGLVLQLQDLLAAAASGSRFVPMGDGVYAALTRSLRELLRDLAAVTDTDRQGTRVPQLAAAWLEDITEGAQLEADTAFRERVERLRDAQTWVPALPGGLQASLRPYQEDGYAWAARLARAGFGACLADDMGLGKTLQALALLLARAQGGPALVVAPTSVCANWVQEALRFAPALQVHLYGGSEREKVVADAGPMDVVVVSYTLLQQGSEQFAGRRWHTLVADEAQAVKNASAKRSLALFEVEADFRIALSGTPLENRLAELWSIMRFCNPGLLGTLPRFNERFANPIERGRDRNAQALLRRLVAPFLLRRTKAQVLEELPPRTELTLTVSPEPAEAAHYEALRRQCVAAAQRAAAAGAQGQLHILAQITRLRRAACDPRLVNPELKLAGAKVAAFAALATELVANGHKALVFSQFTDFLALLREPLQQAGIVHQYLDGSTPAPERARRVAAFQAGEGDIFLISLKAGGFGLNLTAADYVVIADPWWNPAAEDQAMGRAHRMGQLRPVTVYRLVRGGTLEEGIVAMHHDKRALAEGILEGGEVSALPSSEELLELLRS